MTTNQVEMPAVVTPGGTRVLGDAEVPVAGNYFKWNPNNHFNRWQLIGEDMTRLYGLPVATIRARLGEPNLVFAAPKV